MTQDTPRLRLGILAIVALSLFAALFTRLWYLQVLSAPALQLRAQSNITQVVSEPAPRGRILDRNGKVLVDNRASNVVAIDRSMFELLEEKQQHRVLLRLAGVLEAPVDVLEKKLQDQRVSRYVPIPVAEDVAEGKMTLLLEQADDFPTVVAKRVAVRTYPMGSLGAHILGYVSEISAGELEDREEYAQGDLIGKAGIERMYEHELRGKDGELEIEVDAQGRPIRVVDRTPPVQGNDVVLSINADVQKVAEESLAQGLEDTRGNRFEDDGRALVADAGAVVVLDTRGGVEAMASYPTFDLPGLADGVSTEEAAVLFPKDPNTAAPFLNRAIGGLYAPGSTWKIVTADAALRGGLITPNFSLIDRGVYTIPGDCTNVGCIKKNAGSTAYGRVGVQRAMAVSSDVFFYHLGAELWIGRERFGENAIQNSAAMYGFGTETGVPLPAEASGRVLTKALREKLFEEGSPLVSDPGWYTGQNVNLAIGQAEMVVTPIQLANAYATLANGGSRYQPNMVLRIQRQDGTLVKENAPRELERVDLPPHVRDPILRGLVDVVATEDGTAYNAFAGFPLPEYGIAGKTGTAQAPPKQDHALFAAFGPTQDPQHVVTVVMEQSGFGASAAAPVARRVFEVLGGFGAQGEVEFTQRTGLGD